MDAKENLPASFPSTEQGRLLFLDGLRGWGALIVLVYHVFLDAFPINSDVTIALRKFFFFNGVLAVWIFFLVSGLSLSVEFCRRRDQQSLTKIALGRYVRLAVPILCATFILYLFFVTGLILPAEQRLPNFQGFLPVAPSLWDVVRSSLFDTFFDYSFSKALIGPLWTMRFELWGSCLVLGALYVAGRLERRMLVYGALAVVAYFIHPIYTAFVFGLVLAEIHVSTPRSPSASLWSKASLLLLVPGIYGASLLPRAGNDPFGACLTVATLLIIPCIFNATLAKMLSGPVSRYLGRISFPLYLIHGPLLLAYGNRAYQWIDQPTDLEKLWLNLSIAAVSIASATMLTPIDRWGIRAAKELRDFLLARKKPASVFLPEKP
ncbi:acyltransferase family protein [Variovorax paradoxus]|uniref:Acyltransferase 3 domain-containing protein n=1 Tax=Variovorax paradoxus TaxID=34073 RepID=A0A679IQI9_VARPD|nr:hypothetical protein VVAX_01294 [Variovorax paradoxus]